MDKEQEQLQFLGFIGIFTESIKIILSRPKIFTKITLAFILPLTFLSLAYIEISKLLSNKITLNYSSYASTLNNTQVVSPASSYSSKSSTTFSAYTVVSLIVSHILGLLPSCTVTYTVACIYAGNKEITFKKVVSVIPKVWKRLMITLLCKSSIIMAYSCVSAFVLVLILVLGTMFLFKPSNLQAGMTILSIITVILVFVGVTYMVIYMILAYIISVLENLCGFQAIKKSGKLIKGNFGTSLAVYFGLSLCSVPIFLMTQQLMGSGGFGPKILYVILSMVLNPLIMLYGLVVQSVFYFECKSYHHENFNKSSLADHLEALIHGNYYLPLKNEVVEIGQLKV